MSYLWRNLAIGGKPVKIFEPANSERPRFGLLFLPDEDGVTVRGRKSFERPLAELSLACICPTFRPCWWTNRREMEFDAAQTPEQLVLETVLPVFQTRWQLQPPAIGLFGLGVGGQGALRLAFRHADLFRVVAALAPALDCHERYGRGTALDRIYDSKEQCRQDTALLHVHPSKYPPHLFFGIDPADQEWFRGNDRLHEKLAALGIPHEFDFTTAAGGHGWPYFDAMAERALRFVADGLQQESLRLL